MGQLFDIFTTWGHAARFEAEDVKHATDLFTGKASPMGIPPAPVPAETGRDGTHAFGEATPEWQRWYKDYFLPARRRYPTLSSARGECLMSVHSAGARTCPGRYNTTWEHWEPCPICAPEAAGQARTEPS